MKRTYLNIPSVALSLTLFVFATFSSCTRQPDYTNAIPGNATEVLSVNLQTLVQKAGLQEAENQVALDKLTEALKNGLSTELQQQLEDVIENPENLGIDFVAPVYFFRAEQPAVQGMTAKVVDRKRLEKVVEAICKDELFTGLQQTENYSYAYNEQTFVAFNGTTLLAFDTPSSMDIGQMHRNAEQLLNQSEAESATSQPFFARLQELKGDINGLINADRLTDFYPPQYAQTLPANLNLKALKLLGSLNFENGRITLRGNAYTEDASLQALIDRQASASRPAEGKFLPYFPQSTLTLFTLGINGEKLYDSLQAEESLRNQLTPDQALLLQSLLSAFQGDVTIGITGMSATGNLSFAAYAETNDPSILQNLIQTGAKDLDGKLRITQLDNGDYSLKTGSQTLYIGLRGNDLFTTNDNLLYGRIAEKAEPSVLDTDYATDLKEQHVAFIVNAEAILDMPLIKMATGFLSPEHRTYVSMAEHIAYIGLTGQSDTGQLVLELTDKDSNALKQLMDFVKTFIGI